MENKTPPNLIKKTSLLIFTIIINMAMAQKSVSPVRVGVVLDMEHYLGQMGLNCITMALSDFYGNHNYYKTRLVLNIRDSKKDVVGAAAAALDLLKNEEVEAVIGPLSSAQADFLINLGDKAHVPIITFSATNPSLSSIRSPYFIRAALDDSSQIRAISAILQAFGWRQVVAIYEDNEFGKGIVPFLTDALEQVNVHVPYKSVISPLATDDRIAAELYKLMTMQTRVFVVHMLPRLGTRVFAKAKALGMMSGDYAWIVTDGMTNELNSIDPRVMESMRGVIGVQPYIPKTEQLDNFTIRYKKRFRQNNLKTRSLNLNIFGLWAYDSAIALAMAVEKTMIKNDSFLRTNTPSNSMDLEGFGVSRVGKKLIEALSSKIVFGALAGDFELIGGQLQPPPYQIINVVGPGARVIGYWTKENGIVRKLSYTGANIYSTSKSNIGSIVWPGDKTSPPKGWVIPTNGKKLRVGVPVNDVFGKFVQYTWDDHNKLTQVDGYCIDVFDAVVDALPYGIQKEYVPFVTSDHKSKGSYNDLVYEVYLGNFDAVVGDVTIIANRSQFVDFTLPFTESGVSMVVPIKDNKRKDAWVFLSPLTWQLWLTTFFSFIFIGFLIWILEHRVNEDFRGPLWNQVGTIFWFSFSTMVFAQKERVTSNLARFVMIIWFLVVLILTQSYTASLASMLTVQRLQPTVTDVKELLRNNETVAYLRGSFVFGLLKELGFHESRILEYNSSDKLNDLLTKGSKNGGVAAVFDEIPYMKLFLSKHCSNYTMVGPTYKTGGFGFAFPIGSPLVHDISRAILEVTESKKMMAVEKTWLGNEIECLDSSTLLSSDNIGLESFWGLFLIVIIAAVLAFVIYVVNFMRENWHIMDKSDPGSTTWSKTVELLRRFNNRDFNSHTFKRAMKPSCTVFSNPHNNGTFVVVDHTSQHIDDPDVEVNENEVKFVASKISKSRSSSFQNHKSRVTPIETQLQAYLQQEQFQAYQQEEIERERVAATMARYASQSQLPPSHPLE